MKHLEKHRNRYNAESGKGEKNGTRGLNSYKLGAEVGNGEKASTILWVSSWKECGEDIQKSRYCYCDWVSGFSAEAFENRDQYLELDCKG